jgi:hypothetical protein
MALKISRDKALEAEIRQLPDLSLAELRGR